MALPDLQGLLETARRLQSEVARVRDELGNKTVTGETGGGLVRCVANGKGEVVSITIVASILGDRRMVEDLTVVAVKHALDHARYLEKAEIGQATACRQLHTGFYAGGRVRHA